MFTIVPAAAADVPAAADVLAAAFAHDNVMGTLVSGPDKEAKLARLFRALMRATALPAGRVDLARRDEDGVVLGAAIWEQPGRPASVLAYLAELPSFVRALGWRGIGAARRLQRTFAGHRPQEPHWYLAEIGVGAQARGAGVGAALLRSRLAKIDALGLPTYLESSNERNRALYRRHGFRQIATIADVSAEAPASMWREPVPVA